MMHIPNIKSIWLVVSDKNIFKIFYLEILCLACVDQNHLNNYQRGLYKDHSCQVWPKSSQKFRRCPLMQMLTTGMTIRK